MRIVNLVSLVLVTAAIAFADTGDHFYVHYDLVERAAVDAAARNPESWKENAAGFENPYIAMEAEEVTITLYPTYAAVEAVFDFHNADAANRNVEMCFPVSYGMLGVDAYDARDEGFTAEGRDASLEVSVDGKNAAYEVEDTARLAFPAIATWPVAFPAGARRRVICRYRDAYNGGGPMSLAHRFEYVVYTGATWKGPIGKGTLTVRPGEEFDWTVPLYYLGAGIPPARDEGDRIVWEFENLEPSFTARPEAVPDESYFLANAFTQPGAGLTLGIAAAAALAETYTAGGAYAPPAGKGAAAGVMVEGLNFRTAPDADAPRVAGKETLAKREGIAILERRGEWYRARAEGDAEGWVRWRYVDPTSGREQIYVEIIPVAPE